MIKFLQMKYRSIATELILSLETVQTHVKNSYRKLHVHSREEAVS